MPILSFRRKTQETLTAPIELRVVTVGRDRVVLTWTSTTTTQTGFVVDMTTVDPASVDFEESDWNAAQSSSTNSATVHGLVPNTVYYFRVYAERGVTAGPPSSYVAIRTLRHGDQVTRPPFLAGNARRRLQLAAYEYAGGPLLADWSADAVQCVISHNEHGDLDLKASLRLHEQRVRTFTQPRPIVHLEVNDGIHTLWAGQQETLPTTPGGMDVNGLGAWELLNTVKYTAEWSRTDLSGWREVRVGEIAVGGVDTTANEDYVIGLDTDLEIALTAEQPYLPGRMARVVVVQPHRARTTYQRVNGSYSTTLAAALQVRILALSFDLQTVNQTNVIVSGAGGGTPPLITQSGTFDFLIAPSAAVMVEVSVTLGGQYVPVSDDEYVRLTGLRVRAAAGAITPDLIARDLLTCVREHNPGWLNADTTYIQSSGRDLYNESVQDASMMDYLLYLATTSDALGREWRASVQQRYLHLEPLAIGRTWYLDLGDLSIERPTSGLYNRVYATYNDGNGRTLRTEPTNDALISTRYGIVRELTINAETTDAAQAALQRDLQHQDNRRAFVRVKIGPIRKIFDSNNAESPVYLVRVNDQVVPRFLPIYDADDPLAAITIAGTTYDVMTNTLTLTARVSPPELERLLAVQALATYPAVNRT